jgi:hypothetical protein
MFREYLARRLNLFDSRCDQAKLNKLHNCGIIATRIFRISPSLPPMRQHLARPTNST